MGVQRTPDTVMSAADSPPEIRAARPQDATAVAGLLDQLGFPTTVDVVALRLDALDRTGETVLIARRDTEVLGFVSLHVTPVLHRPTPVGRMTALVVNEQARGKGIGRALVAAAEQHLADAGCALIEVTSRHDHTGAHAFYQRLGYAITSHRFGKALPHASRRTTKNTERQKRATLATYAVSGTLAAALGVAALVRPSLAVPSEGYSPLTAHLVREGGALGVFVGLMAFWGLFHFEQRRPVHFALLLLGALFAGIHWADYFGGDRTLLSPLLNSIPFLAFAVTAPIGRGQRVSA